MLTIFYYLKVLEFVRQEVSKPDLPNNLFLIDDKKYDSNCVTFEQEVKALVLIWSILSTNHPIKISVTEGEGVNKQDTVSYTLITHDMQLAVGNS